MDKLLSILLLVERGSQVHQALNKAVVLARHFRARLELLLCESEQQPLFARVGLPEAERGAAHLAEAFEYLQALRHAILVSDVEVHSDVAFGTSAHECLERKLRASRPDLLVRALALDASGHPRIDWPQVLSVPTPLWLTRGRPWHPEPRFVAAVDVLDQRRPQLADCIVAAGNLLRTGCAARLDLMYALQAVEPPGIEHAGGAQRESERAAAALARLAEQHRLERQRLHLLGAQPAESVPEFIRHGDYDLLILGRPAAGRRAPDDRRLASRMLRSLDCDVLFVGEPAACAAQARRAAGAA